MSQNPPGQGPFSPFPQQGPPQQPNQGGWNQAPPPPAAPPQWPPAGGPPAQPPQQPPGGGWNPPPPPMPPAYAMVSNQGMSSQYSSWPRRLGAYLIDEAIMGVVYLILAVFLGGIIAGTATTTNINGVVSATVGGAIIVMYLLFSVIALVYTIVLPGVWKGQTVGMMVVGIAVKDERTGQTIGLGRAFLRWLVFFALFLACSIPGIINCLSPLWDQKLQTWHDKAVHSVVVRVSS